MANQVRFDRARWRRAAGLMLGFGALQAAVLLLGWALATPLVAAALLTSPALLALAVGTTVGDTGRSTWVLPGLLPLLLAWAVVILNEDLGVRGILAPVAIVQVLGVSFGSMLLGVAGEWLHEQLAGRRGHERASRLGVGLMIGAVLVTATLSFAG